MDLLNTIKDLVRIKSETGNEKEIDRCLLYIKDSFKNTCVKVRIERFDDASPVIYISNNDNNMQDVLVLGHIDVVSATDDMYEPKIVDNKMYGRGTLDMKSFVAVAMNSMHYVLENNVDVKFGIIISTDEEKGSKSTHAFMEKYPNISAKVVLDNDVGGDITKIVSKCKNPVFVKLFAKGIQAHGSTPWAGLDANELLMRTIANLREFYPYFDINTKEPKNTWIDTMHVALMSGGEVSNIIAGNAEALLDFRLIETSTLDDLENNIRKSLLDGVSYKIVSSSNPVVMNEDDKAIVNYKKLAEKIMNKNIEFEQIGGATDARLFAQKGATVIMHSGSGEGMHADNEYVEIKTVEMLAKIQIEYLKNCKSFLD